MDSENWKDQYNKAMIIATDLYEYALVLDTKDEILEYQLAIVCLLNNCNVTIADTWSKRLNRLKSITDDKHFEEKLSHRIRSGKHRLRKYENRIKLLNNEFQYFFRSEGVLE